MFKNKINKWKVPMLIKLWVGIKIIENSSTHSKILGESFVQVKPLKEKGVEGYILKMILTCCEE